MRAGRLMLERIAELSNARANFGFETTLSGRTYVKLLGKMRRDGYRVVLFFLWLPTLELAIGRVRNRVRQGGHSIPPDTILRRYGAGLRNFFRLDRPLADEWSLYDASWTPPALIAFKKDKRLTIRQKELFRQIEVSGSAR